MEDPGEGDQSGEESPTYGYFSDEDSSDCEDSGDGTVGRTGSGESLNGPHPAAISSEGCGTETREAVSQPPTVLHWVRMSALRIHDNPALQQALLDTQRRLRCVFIIDPWFIRGRIGENRCRFLLESLHDLDKKLRAYCSRLYVVQGQPIAAMEQLIRQWNVQQLTFQQDMEPYSQRLEESVAKVAKISGVEVSVSYLSAFPFTAHTLYHPAAMLAANGNKPILTQKAFRELVPKLGAPTKPIAVPDPDSEVFSTKLYSEEDPDVGLYRIPTMSEMGFEDCSLYTNVWVGGETEALRRLPLYCQLRSQNTDNTVDMLFDKSALSPYVRFGCLSVRYFLWKTRAISSSNPAVESVVRQLTQKLLNREFYFVVASQVPNYDITENNPICLQLPWETDTSLLPLWREGKTGYPWIDAAMRQLRKEGWIHYYLRESVAAFLTSGDLWISWVAGKDTFEELLLDYEPTVSCGLWMKSSCSTFLHGPIPYYCPITFGQKIDPKGQYIRTFCPELRNMPSEYIFSPWLAPPHVQKAANCIIGADYPNPMIDHTTAGALCCERIRSILKSLHSLMPNLPQGLPVSTTPGSPSS
ncbi:Cryptochrome-2 [Geodia barretti]|uniref:Cryptochrome-2 n=1 Tax=Geodia barretti TaxID=519541 RepID=A0AA35X572_GEOBA|nr:Cryptochrome-2 [Geodia barretti]